MRSIENVITAAPGYLIYILLMLLLTGQLFLLIQAVRIGRSHVRILVYAIIFLALFVFTIFMIHPLYLNALGEQAADGVYRSPRGFDTRLLTLPWGMVLFPEIALGAVLLAQMQKNIRYRRMHIGPNTIQEAVDLLPVAVCICEKSGTVLLSNLSMQLFHQALTGASLHDAACLWQYIEENGEAHDGRYLIRTGDGRVWLCSRETIRPKDAPRKKEYMQLTASDMTGQFLLNEKLSEENEKMRIMLERMKEVAARERALVISREILRARMSVHNHMGGVLLSGKYYLDHPSAVKEEEILRLLEHSNTLLLREAEQEDDLPDPLSEALKLAQRIGIGVQIEGDVPKEEPAHSLIAQAVDQCAANAVRHAKADILFVRIDKTNDRIRASFSNNGEPPAGPVAETGGLANLRTAVNAAGGSMTVQSEPAFLLTLSVDPKTPRRS